MLTSTDFDVQAEPLHASRTLANEQPVHSTEPHCHQNVYPMAFHGIDFQASAIFNIPVFVGFDLAVVILFQDGTLVSMCEV